MYHLNNVPVGSPIEELDRKMKYALNSLKSEAEVFNNINWRELKFKMSILYI